MKLQLVHQQLKMYKHNMIVNYLNYCQIYCLKTVTPVECTFYLFKGMISNRKIMKADVITYVPNDKRKR